MAKLFKLSKTLTFHILKLNKLESMFMKHLRMEMIFYLIFFFPFSPWTLN